MIAIPLSEDDRLRRKTAKILERVTGLKPDILPPDDYGRLWYEFSVKPKDPNQKQDERPFVVGELNDYLMTLRYHADATSTTSIQMSPKDDWLTTVRLHFSDVSGFSIPPELGLEAAKAMEAGLKRYTKQRYGRVNTERYHEEQFAQYHFQDASRSPGMDGPK